MKHIIIPSAFFNIQNGVLILSKFFKDKIADPTELAKFKGAFSDPTAEYEITISDHIKEIKTLQTELPPPFVQENGYNFPPPIFLPFDSSLAIRMQNISSLLTLIKGTLIIKIDSTIKDFTIQGFDQEETKKYDYDRKHWEDFCVNGAFFKMEKIIIEANNSNIKIYDFPSTEEFSSQKQLMNHLAWHCPNQDMIEDTKNIFSLNRKLDVEIRNPNFCELIDKYSDQNMEYVTYTITIDDTCKHTPRILENTNKKINFKNCESIIISKLLENTGKNTIGIHKLFEIISKYNTKLMNSFSWDNLTSEEQDFLLAFIMDKTTSKSNDRFNFITAPVKVIFTLQCYPNLKILDELRINAIGAAILTSCVFNSKKQEAEGPIIINEPIEISMLELLSKLINWHRKKEKKEQ